MIRAAGILIISDKGNALFLKRGPGGDMPGLWCFPGGRLEGDEDELQAAVRETLEEAGFKADPSKLEYWTRTVSARETTGAPPTPPPGRPDDAPLTLLENLEAGLKAPVGEAIVVPGEQVDFTTFVLNGVPQFEPKLCDEHVGYAWAPPSQPPVPLHPGCRIALRKAIGMNELEIAEAIRDGELTSPQRFGKFYLFAIRITGTGVAYRARKLDDKGKVVREAEYVWREPDHYLNPEFLARCNGLPVVLEHPKDEMVDSKEFEERTIGTCFLPYIVGDEVWCVAKIYDEFSAKLMAERQLSTSPGVVWHEAANTMSTVDGHNLLIEGKPNLLDHIAICWQGVWDKGGEPRGVSSNIATRGDSEMTQEEMAAKIKADQEREDRLMAAIAGLGTHVKDLTSRVDSVQTRFDEEDKKEEERKRADARRRIDSFKFSKRADAPKKKGKGLAEGFMEGGSFHPIRSSSGYNSKKAGDSAEEKARMDAEEEEMKDLKEARDSEEREYAEACMQAGDSEEVAKKKAADARKDAEEAEKKENDEDEEKEEKARKDAEDEKEKEERRADSVALADLRKQIAELRASTATPKAMTDAELNAMGAFQARADSVYTAFGQRTPAPLPGQSLLLYRRSIAGDLKKHTKFKDSELSVIAADEKTFDIICDQIIEEAQKVANSPASIPAGTLKMKSTRSDSGHTINEWEGQPKAWMGPMAGEVKQYALKFNVPG